MNLDWNDSTPRDREAVVGRDETGVDDPPVPKRKYSEPPAGSTERKESETHSTAGTCRFAGWSDREQALKLWQAYLTEGRRGGSYLWDDDHNLMLFRRLFDAYTRGRLFGVVVLWTPGDREEPQGMVLAGEEGGENDWHTDYAKLAVLWGVYVHPSYRGSRLGLQMELYGRPRLRSMGFTHAATSVRVGNDLGRANWRHWDEAVGVQTQEVRIIASLSEPKE